MDAQFGAVEGVWRTRVGYAGGDRENPTYHDLGDQTECFQVDYDPTVVSYEELVDMALSAYDPWSGALNRQYAFLVLAHDDEQLRIARERARVLSEKRGKPIGTHIERLKKFWPAEDYHQKYYLRNKAALRRDFEAMFGDDQVALRESTAAMRVNAYAHGYGTKAQLAEEIEGLGLSEEGQARLRSLVKERAGSAGCAVP